MNTKLLMTFSAFLMGVVGAVLLFLPNELLTYDHSIPQTASYALILQVLGALYFAFAMVNWTAKANLIGGIYARPIAIGNLIHFMIGAFVLSKGYFSTPQSTILILSLIYTCLCILFAVVVFSHPVKGETANRETEGLR
jgi:hypothetical protein